MGISDGVADVGRKVGIQVGTVGTRDGIFEGAQVGRNEGILLG